MTSLPQSKLPVVSATSTPMKLIFDDGSRVMTASTSTTKLVTSSPTNIGRDQFVSVRDYYEIDRITQEIHSLIDRKQQHEFAEKDEGSEKSVYSFRIALQFPDELLVDAPEVCWEFDQLLPRGLLVFCLGDTTYSPCCPDVAAASHLDADCIVHYGHACFSSSQGIPVLYSFGGQRTIEGKDRLAGDRPITPIVDLCTKDVLSYIDTSKQDVQRILLMYEVQYHHIINQLATALAEHGDLIVVCAKIPKGRNDGISTEQNKIQILDNVCYNSNSLSVEPIYANKQMPTTEPQAFILGGLELPDDIDVSDYSLLFVGNDSCRQFINIALRFLSMTRKPQNFWSWRLETASPSPSLSVVTENHSVFSTTLSESFQRKLNRRFYLIEKSKQFSIFGILVANQSDTRVRTIVQLVSDLIEYETPPRSEICNENQGDGIVRKRSGRSSYTFMVGKLNPAKLANFAEIQCFVLVACPEHSILEDEKEFSVPVITPLELCMALGVTEWGSIDYSLDTRDFIELLSKPLPDKRNDSFSLDDNDIDKPFFSIVTGKYEVATTGCRKDDDATDLSSLPGQGKLVTYHSDACEFLKSRDYQGLIVDKSGDIKVATAAQPGLSGIASNYNNR